MILGWLIIIEMTNILRETTLGSPNMTKEKGKASIIVAQEPMPVYKGKMLWHFIIEFTLSTGSS